MQERKVIVSRFLAAKRFESVEKESPTERAARFVDGQKQISLYPFSPNFSVKAALGGGKTIGGKKEKNPSADNKQKEKRKLEFRRLGLDCYDPKATAQPGQYFNLWPNKNLDGQRGDVANIGWLDPSPLMNPKDFKNQVDYMLQVSAQGPQLTQQTVKPNKRTGAIKSKSLGNNIGKITGTVGRAAIRALGIVVDADGKMRCPPGVPAANQFTDEIGSNCFDFTPSVGQTLVAIAQRLGYRNLSDAATLNAALPIGRNEDGQIVEIPRDVYRDARRAARSASGMTMEIPPVTPSGPSSESSAGLRASAVVIDRADYEKVFRKNIREAFPDLPDSEVDRLTKVAVERAQIQDAINDEKRNALDVVRRVTGIDFDEKDPAAVQRALIIAVQELGVNLGNYLDFLGDDDSTLAAHNAKLHYGAVHVALDWMRANNPEEFQKLVKLVGGENQLKRILLGSGDWKIDKPDAELMEEEKLLKELLKTDAGKKLWKRVEQNNLRIKEYETGLLLGLVNLKDKNPKLADEAYKWIGMLDWRQAHKDGNFDVVYDAQYEVRDMSGRGDWQGGVMLNPIGMLATMRDMPEFPDEYTLFQANGAGTEVAKLQKIAGTVEKVTREREAREFLSGIDDYQKVKQKAESGEEYTQHIMTTAAGHVARAQYVFHHETMHGRQTQLVHNYLVTLRDSPAGGGLRGMTNEDLLDLAFDLVLGRKTISVDGREVDYSDMLADPKFLGGMVDDLPNILNELWNRNSGGRYAKNEMWQAIAIKHILDGQTEKQKVSRYNESLERLDYLRRTGQTDTAEYQGLLTALQVINSTYGKAGHSMRGEAWEEAARELRRHSAKAIMELQAEVGAGVATGIIKRTPEIDAFLSPLGTGLEKMPAPEFYVPAYRRGTTLPGGIEIQSGEQARAQAEFLKDEARKFFSRKKRKIAQTIRDGGVSSRSGDEKLMDEALEGTVALKSRSEVSRWAKSVSDRVMSAATQRQKQVLGGKWQKAKWNSADASDWRNMLVLTPEQLVDSVESQLIPFTELIDSSVLPEGAAAEILLPSAIFDDGMGNIAGAMFAIDNHFVGVLKSDADIGISDGPSSPDAKRMIVAVPEGFKGLPNQTPGTDGGEIGSIVLPPGQIEIIGMRSDGTLMGRVVSQRSAEEHLREVRQKLHSLETQQYRPMRERIAARRAVHKIDEGQRLRRGARSAAAVAMEMDPRASRIAEKIEYDPQEQRLTVTYKDKRKADFEGVGYGLVRDAGAKNDPDTLIRELEKRGPRNPAASGRGARSSSTIASTYGDSADTDIAQQWIKSLDIPLQEPRETMKPKTVEEAIRYILDGYAVDMPDIEGAHTLLSEFAEIVATVEDLYKQGKITKQDMNNFVFDLCAVTVANASVFCADNLGIPRYMMPQAEGEPVEGSIAHKKLQAKKTKKAEEMRKLGSSEDEIKEALDKMREVDMTDEFKEWLKEKGYGVGDATQYDSKKLKASQRDMQGHKVAPMFGGSLAPRDEKIVETELEKAASELKETEDRIKDLVSQGKADEVEKLQEKLREQRDKVEKLGKELWRPWKKPILISRDGYVVDGHHRWAATLSHEFRNGSLNSHMMNVIVVDLPIMRVLQLANEFTSEVGIQRKTVAQRTKDADDKGDYSKRIMDLVRQARAERHIEDRNFRWEDYLKSLGVEEQKPRPRKVVNTVEEGVEALLNGYEVDMPSTQGTAMFMQEIAELVASLKEMKDAGTITDEEFNRFVFDLCQVTAANTSAFCLGNKGIPRWAMPQAAGKPVEGTTAKKKFDAKVAELQAAVDTAIRNGAPEAEVQKAKKALDKFLKENEIDGSEEFIAFVESKGYKVKRGADGKPIAERVDTSTLKATQRDMLGNQVAGMFGSSLAGTYDPSKKPIFVTRDGYVIDGHHRFAATLAADMMDGELGNNHHMNVVVIDAPLSAIIPLANQFANSFGIAPKKVTEQKEMTPEREAETKEYMKSILQKINAHNRAKRGHDAVPTTSEIRHSPVTQLNNLLSRTDPAASRGARSSSAQRPLQMIDGDATFKITDMPADVREFIRERKKRAQKRSEEMKLDKPSSYVAMLERLENGYQIDAFERQSLIDEMTRIEEGWIRAGGIDMPKNQIYSATERAAAARLNAMLNRGNPGFVPAKGVDLRDIDVDHDSEFGPNAFSLPNIDGHARNGRLHDGFGRVIGKYNVPRGKEGLIESAEGGYYFDVRGNIVGTYEYFKDGGYGAPDDTPPKDESVTIGRRLSRRFRRPKKQEESPSIRRPRRSDLYT